ncbi:hypothetical protein PIB19_15015 [Sphingomonas sp. 7/4-4]|uniref:hypothetical protein n=1 Tax=Sphingomonas sp. 7/4-4 TaxID=3018446 RepID=UPI0022F3FBCD|nr:hypothetical protein [Sphingomonas sp. 7/4-4]WBY06814.1 hypothetical protein PIB19_15015 [Sphingomonas sp. 7/4-4]
MFGSPGSSITGNVFVNGWGAAIYIGANSGRCIIGNNSTIGNGVSLRIDDGNGTQTSFDVRLGTNSFTEGAEGKGIVEFAGNVSVAPQVFYASDGVGATLTPQAGLAAHILFTNTAGVPVFYLGQEEGPDGPNLIIYRAGQAQNSLVVRANGDVSIFRRTFADNAAALAGGVGVGGDYKTATSEVRTVVV